MTLAYDIPGFGALQIEHLVLDYNGTLAVDGSLVPGVAPCLHQLAKSLTVHVITADTFGKAADHLSETPCQLTVLPPGRQDQAKLDFVNQLGADKAICIGNGRNDARMLAAAAIGIAVVLEEGASTVCIHAADICCTRIVSALELLMHPLRLTATLRC